MATVSGRGFFHCGTCDLVFADPNAHPSPDAEKARYSLHQNNPQDAGYRRFLGSLISALDARLGPQSLEGLDYGCGPSPVLAGLLEEKGHRIARFDPYFANDPKVLERQYDVVTSTEVVEHFREPGQEWERLVALVKPGGWLGIMTKLSDRFIVDTATFASWPYIRDQTHLCFYSRQTFRFLASRHGFRVEWEGDNVILLQKPHGSVG